MNWSTALFGLGTTIVAFFLLTWSIVGWLVIRAMMAEHAERKPVISRDEFADGYAKIRPQPHRR